MILPWTIIITSHRCLIKYLSNKACIFSSIWYHLVIQYILHCIFKWAHVILLSLCFWFMLSLIVILINLNLLLFPVALVLKLLLRDKRLNISNSVVIMDISAISTKLLLRDWRFLLYSILQFLSSFWTGCSFTNTNHVCRYLMHSILMSGFGLILDI